ncbi:GNAT family N-acetyltransferase [Cereibacter sphaeroides]|uniref:GNAT family N-acetyltransferase n=1 Tax=Rhodobacterales TaxID=204455 RepID=UPI000BBE330D|nr:MULTISPECIES: GNAT family N-acetyltransferase [Paracoccaceae]MCE6950027.1 GNAT family N-acetyltransferase [Cereibacter sphaeroides]MCE6958474.1 GNAT family N-acetyltransferase [Cereibacter sphaeroides]MCE6967736.1 GNAT family N-acetyltransferase [Cereibacter sphaeroides]MCE6972679.1 GNAT family N-acetyltransferase [Cereibacter sphaeroides]
MTSPWSHPITRACAMQAAGVAGAVPEIATRRLRLRAPRLDDFATYAEIVGSDRGRHIGGPLPRAEAWDDFCRMTATWLLRGHGLWSVELDADLLGFVLIGMEPGDPDPELGFLFTAEAEGQGYAQEAAEAARHHAFTALGLPRLVSCIAPDNFRSRRLAERLGARLDPGTLDGVLVYRHPVPEVSV